MMKTFFTSDTHFGHRNLLALAKARGARFASIEEHDAELERLWNATVGVDDEVFHLGDVAFMNRRALDALLRRLNGRKFLLMGNHDKFPVAFYAEHFKVLRQPYPWSRGVVLTHAPLHPMCLAGRWKVNVHGHIHEAHVRLRPFATLDARYKNVCVEHTGFAPVDAAVLFPAGHKCAGRKG